MQLQAELTWVIDFGIVDLNLIGLGESGGLSKENGKRQCNRFPQIAAASTKQSFR